MNDEEIRGTITPNLGPEEAYHIITFDSSSSYPHSTNNTTLDNDSGSLGRSVPDGKFHVVSTGYCKGQYRTIECVIEKPPFPFGLATSGPIDSSTPLVVKGVSSIEEFQNGEDDRPGHILCNSAEGVNIAQVSPPRPTEISGFVKSAGSVDIAQPAVVRGGIRSQADVSTLAQIDIEAFRNQGAPGVVTLRDDTYPLAQEMDIMYYYSGTILTYESRVNLLNAMLYVDGDLVVNGPVTGEGLIVVNGNATFNSGTSLSGDNKMAVLASGDITINGNNNYFSGLVYSAGNLNASNVTIIGNTIVNSSDPHRGGASLDNVTIVSNEQTADMTITVTSSGLADAQVSDRRFPFPVQASSDGTHIGIPDGVDPGSLDGWPDPDMSPAEISTMMKGSSSDGSGDYENNLWNAIVNSDQAMELGTVAEDAPEIRGLLTSMLGVANQAGDLRRQRDDLHDELGSTPPPTPDRIQDINDELGDIDSALEALFSQFNAYADTMGQLVWEYGRSHTEPNGTYGHPSIPMDITQEHRFNLNEYLPESERVKVSFWRVYPRKF